MTSSGTGGGSGLQAGQKSSDLQGDPELRTIVQPFRAAKSRSSYSSWKPFSKKCTSWYSSAVHASPSQYRPRKPSSITTTESPGAPGAPASAPRDRRPVHSGPRPDPAPEGTGR